MVIGIIVALAFGGWNWLTVGVGRFLGDSYVLYPVFSISYTHIYICQNSIVQYLCSSLHLVEPQWDRETETERERDQEREKTEKEKLLLLAVAFIAFVSRWYI